jgi:hypothetical protein
MTQSAVHGSSSEGSISTGERRPSRAVLRGTPPCLDRARPFPDLAHGRQRSNRLGLGDGVERHADELGGPQHRAACCHGHDIGMSSKSWKSLSCPRSTALPAGCSTDSGA